MAGPGTPSDGAEEWFRRARRYLRVAKALLEVGFPDVASFNAQQAAEFSLKALALHRTGSFSRIHDLPRLAGDVAAPTRIVNLATLLTGAYVGSRYPDVGGPKITRQRAEAYLDAGRRIVRWVRRQMV
ncbi:MAG TPA: HEPN domain-containing protein [Thermoplasmata archaeon]|nr:HEPN domain-containing protein [Thermoplasmata archaeon]